jgi:hypothetical protein
VPTASAYAATYLDPPSGLLNVTRYRQTAKPRTLTVRTWRGEIASGLSHLQRDLRAGYTPAQAQANVPKWVTTAVTKAATASGVPAVLTDFQAIDTP